MAAELSFPERSALICTLVKCCHGAQQSPRLEGKAQSEPNLSSSQGLYLRQRLEILKESSSAT